MFTQANATVKTTATIAPRRGARVTRNLLLWVVASVLLVLTLRRALSLLESEVVQEDESSSDG